MYLISDPSTGYSKDCIEVQLVSVGEEGVEDLCFDGGEFDVEVLCLHG